MTTIVMVANKGTHTVRVMQQEIDGNDAAVGDFHFVCELKPGTFSEQVVLHSSAQIVIREEP